MTIKRTLLKTKRVLRRKVRRRFGSVLKFSIALVLFGCFAVFITFKFIEKNNNPIEILQNFIYFEPINSFYRQDHSFFQKIDYHDYELIEREKNQIGLPGENGQPVYVEPEEEELEKKIFDVNGYNGLVSDKIALNRSLPDVRPAQCKKIHYLKELPSVSVVITFYNDHLSTLLRTVYSVIIRSPPHLLKEVILVNDHSTKEFLYDELEEHVKKHFKHLVRIIILPRRSGLIWARLAGARAASGDVILFLDSHTEANINFLPPLLEPIARDYRTCVCPYIDVINYETFAYNKKVDGSRGAFNWRMTYQYLPLRPKDHINDWDRYENPVMQGGLFAISSKFFWELGGYDTGLDIWGGEQYELSFKIWLCGGKLYDIPCSRIGHVYRGGHKNVFPNDRKGIDFIATNFKRVAEVWMDEYKEFIYMRDRKRYANVSEGDISYQLRIKEKNKCKPFKYFMEVVAPDIFEHYPPLDPPGFAHGAVQSMANPKFCMDKLNRPKGEPIGLFFCAKDLVEPQVNQLFSLTYYRTIALGHEDDCIDGMNGTVGDEIKSFGCHHAQGNQYFRYDLDSQQIYFGQKRNNKCIEANVETQTLFIGKCEKSKIQQKWKWGFVNETNLRNWVGYGVKIIDNKEIEELSKQ